MSKFKEKKQELAQNKIKLEEARILKEEVETPPNPDLEAPIGTPVGQSAVTLLAPTNQRGQWIPVENVTKRVYMVEQKFIPGTICFKVPNVTNLNQPPMEQVSVAQSFAVLAAMQTSLTFKNLFFIPTSGGSSVNIINDDILKREAYAATIASPVGYQGVQLNQNQVIQIYDNIYYASSTGVLNEDCDVFVQLPSATNPRAYWVAYSAADNHQAVAGVDMKVPFKVSSLCWSYSNQSANGVFLVKLVNFNA